MLKLTSFAGEYPQVIVVLPLYNISVCTSWGRVLSILILLNQCHNLQNSFNFIQSLVLILSGYRRRYGKWSIVLTYDPCIWQLGTISIMVEHSVWMWPKHHAEQWKYTNELCEFQKIANLHAFLQLWAKGEP